MIVCIASTLLLTLTLSASDLNLPDPLITASGEAVTTPDQWREVRRPEILELFRTHMYGRRPVGRPDDLRFEVRDVTPDAMDGAATRKLVDILYSGPGGDGKIQLILFIPNDAPKPAPAFVLICHRDAENIDPTREVKMPFWPAEQIVARGYAAATFHVSDVAPDDKETWKQGVYTILPAPDEAEAWGAISIWGWGASRILDYFETDADVDETHVAVVGHSRGGKAALCCGAEDERFALTCSNDSGCTGAAIARRKKGESVHLINSRFPHWFCPNYDAFNGREEALPVDQHQLVALMAPRLVYVASASEDDWADPEGEFLSCVHAGPVYALFGLDGVSATEMPAPDQPLQGGHIGYHLRSGKHDLTEYDWHRYIDFADKHWK